MISNNVAILQVKTQMSLCRLFLGLETSNGVHSVALISWTLIGYSSDMQML